MESKNLSVELKGDSVSSLAWASTGNFQSGRSHLTALLLSLIMTRANVRINKITIFEKGSDNYDADFISRGGSTEGMSWLDVKNRYLAEIFVDFDTDPWIRDFFELVNPEHIFSTINDMTAHWGHMQQFVDSMVLFGSDATLSSSAIDFPDLQLFVSAPGRKAWVLKVSTVATVDDVLVLIEAKYGVPSNSLKVRFQRKSILLKNNLNISAKEFGLVNGDVLLIIAEGKGGMNSYVTSSLDDMVDSKTVSLKRSSSYTYMEEHFNNFEASRRIPDDQDFLRFPGNDDIVSTISKRYTPHSSMEEHFKKFEVPRRTSDDLWARYSGKHLGVSGVLQKSTFEDSSLDLLRFSREGDIANLNEIQGVEMSTARNYERTWNWWLEFLRGRDQLDILFLRGVPLHSKRLIVVNFIVWMAKVAMRSEDQIFAILSGIRYQFVRRAEDVEIFCDDTIALAKRHFKESARVTSIRRLQGGGRICLPVNYAVLMKVREWALEVDISIINRMMTRRRWTRRRMRRYRSPMLEVRRHIASRILGVASA